MNEIEELIHEKINSISSHLSEAKEILCDDISTGYTWDNYIPEGVTDHDQLFWEMAEIYPGYNRDHNIKGGFKVCVYENKEGPIPHVHIYYDKKGEKNHGKTKTVAYVCLAKAEYAKSHIKETKILNSDERKALVAYFKTEIPDEYGKDKNGNIYQRTCWEGCVKHWIDENPGSEENFKVDKETGRFVMPDYSELK